MTVPIHKQRRLAIVTGTDVPAYRRRHTPLSNVAPRRASAGEESATPTSAEEFRQWLEGYVRLLSHAGALVDPARLGSTVLEHFDAFVRAEGERVLDLAAAARATGLSVDHIARQVRYGQVPNAGRKGKPAIRRRDLPTRKHAPSKRPNTTRNVARPRRKSYDPLADARTLGSRKSGVANGDC